MVPPQDEARAHEYGEQLARASWDLAQQLRGVRDTDPAYYEAAYFLTHVTMDVVQEAATERRLPDHLVSPRLYSAQRIVIDAVVCFRLGISADGGWPPPLVHLQRVSDLASRHLFASYQRQRWYHQFESRVTDPGRATDLHVQFCRQLARSVGIPLNDRRLDRLGASAVAALVAIDPAGFARGMLRDASPE